MTDNITIGDIKYFLDPSTEDEIKEAEIKIDGADLLRDAGLETAVLISLGTDARAKVDDTLLNPEDTRSGWWGNVLLETELGSRLWLLNRSNITDETLTAAEQYAQEALDWMVTDELATSVTTTATKGTETSEVSITVQIDRATGNSIFFKFFENWRYQIFGGNV